jgi:hypothetical protein
VLCIREKTQNDEDGRHLIVKNSSVVISATQQRIMAIFLIFGLSQTLDPVAVSRGGCMSFQNLIVYKIHKLQTTQQKLTTAHTTQHS